MDHSQPIPRPQEAVLLDVIGQLSGSTVFCNTGGRAQFAAAYADQNPTSRVCCWDLDLYQCQKIIDLRRESRSLDRKPDDPSQPEDPLQIVCVPDPPSAPYDLVALMFSSQGEAELTRDLMHSTYRLAANGAVFAVSSDNRDDTWLGAEMRALFPKVARTVTAQGVVYFAKVSEPRAKTKTFVCDLAFRDRGRLLHLRTRPGVFAHRRVDPAARKVMEAMQVDPGSRVLEIGCGSGAVSLAAATRSEHVEVVALDSNPRAIECLQWSATRNHLTNIITRLDADGTTVEPGAFDLVLANPPYYSKQRIAEIFIATAVRALRTGGTLLLVTKHPQWYVDNLGQWFTEAQIASYGNYWIATCQR